MSDVTSIMMAATSADLQVRAQAESVIYAARTDDLPNFLVALVQELRNAEKPMQSRQMAGIVLKNSVAFAHREVELKKQLDDVWRAVPTETRDYVKNELLMALDCPETDISRIVALAIANLARIELPAGEWLNLPESLCAAVSSANPQWMETGLTTLGYVCEECIGNNALAETLAQFADQILDAIFKGLYHDSDAVKYHAIRALCNAIDFIGAQMKDPAKRRALFDGICLTAGTANAETRAKALETLCVVARLYYEALGEHMDQLWTVTVAAIQQDEEGPALQGILFWIAIAEVEAEMTAEEEQHQAYTTGVCGNLFQIVAWCLQKQDQFQSEDDWNLSTAGSKLLVAMAEAVGDGILEIVMPFVAENIGSSQWRQREAAILAFGAILHGPTPGSCEQLVAQYLPTIGGYLNDPVALVVDTAGWAISIISAEYSKVVLSEQFLEPVLGAVGPLLAKEPNLVSRAAAIIHNLSLYYDDDDDDDEEQPTNELSPYYSSIVMGLLAALDRRDLQDQMKHDVQESINRLFGAAAPDCFQVLVELIPAMLQRLRATSEAMQREATVELEVSQGLIVGSLTHISRRVKRLIVPHLPSIMEGLQFMFGCARDGSVLAEGIMCIGSLALACRQDFVPWLESIHPFIQAAIVAITDYDLCVSGISSLGDLAAATEQGIAPMLPETMNNLLAGLSNPECDDELKGAMISCLGDLALNAGGAQFAPYLDAFVAAVQAIDAESRQEQLTSGSDPSVDEYVGSLWENILAFGTGLVQGFADDLTPLLPHLDYLLDFVMHAATHMENDDDVVKGCVTLLGDMANAMRHGPPEYHAAARDKLCTNAVVKIIQNGSEWNDNLVSAAAEWARKELQHLSNTR